MTGLGSFQNTEEGTARSDPGPEEDEPVPAKKRSFFNVFEKIYTKGNKED